MDMIRRLSRALLLSLLFFILLIQVSVNANAVGEEVIHSFHSDIVINSDSTMQVTETIQVYCANISIVHGIYRDFPTRYKDQYGNNFNVGFAVQNVLRDGKPEKFSVSSMQNGKRVKIGSKDVYLEPGYYTYTIIYNTHRQLGYFENNDELFWNVNGIGWMFPVLSVSATVTLPAALSPATSRLGGYTGVAGSTEKSLACSISADGKAVFKSTRELAQGENMSIYVTFPKGIVKQPSTMEKTIYWINDNLFACLLMLGAILSLVIYLYGWLRFGIDPKKGTIIPLFTPPAGLAPAELRYIRRMGYDNKALTASIINMAVKGYLTIEDLDASRKSEYVIRKTDHNYEKLSESEKVVANELPFELELRKQYNPVMTKLITNHNVNLNEAFSKANFTRNSRFVVWSMLVTVAAFVAAFVFAAQSISVVAIVPVLVLIVPHLFFWDLLKAPTPEGRKLMDQIEGFRRFLMVTEKDRLNLLNPPEQTPELFEKYLPYALALDVDQQWSEQFSAMFSRMAADGHSYSPIWYSGSAWNMHHTMDFSHSLNNSFSTAISSASTPPGSSSGSSGGSGGGGGGGGGGGW